MDKIILDIVDIIKRGETISDNRLAAIIRRHNKNMPQGQRHHAKKYLMPYYLKTKNNQPEVWATWGIDPQTERKLKALLQVKPKRSASGVATITVITKPWKCGGNCIFCPNDIRMPKSYLSNEPACQRAERNYFDPYLQVVSRLKALHEMGHNTDKVEIIILGGTWNDYPEEYQRWFIKCVFDALNHDITDEGAYNKKFEQIESFYESAGISNNISKNEEDCRDLQQQLNSQQISYNEAFEKHYLNPESPWSGISAHQSATWEELETEHRKNETAKHRCVGLVVETRPAIINPENLSTMRRLGCTKVQIGVQSLDTQKMAKSDRSTPESTTARAFALLRLFGFKIHGHFMVNLPGASPQRDKQDFAMFVRDGRFLPDEIKLYPCMLVQSARLNKLAAAGKWKAYDERALTDVLADDVLITPAYTRISRMMRDISSGDITQGVRKTNLRQMVEIEAEKRAQATDTEIQEIRHREISMAGADVRDFLLKILEYDTSVTTEYFLQFVTPENKILGFCRLSLPKVSVFERAEELGGLPISADEAMIREVHVYGKVANIGQDATNAQHLGLGKQLIERACEIAKEAGFAKINVISAIGTRKYYEKRGFLRFSKNGFYQQRDLQDAGKAQF